MVKKLAVTAIVTFMLVFSVLIGQTTGGENPVRIIVKSETVPDVDGLSTGIAELDSTARYHGVKNVERAFQGRKDKNAALKKQFGLDRYVVMEFPARADAEKIAAEIAGLPGVEAAEIDRMGQGAALPPNDTQFYQQWNLENTGQNGGTPGADINASGGWEYGMGSSDVSVAVLDTGIDSNHPEFRGRIGTGYDCVNEDDNPEGDHYHGTACSGLILANADNAFQIAGIDWHCRLMPVKVLRSDNTGYTSDLIQGITYAADHGADVISMSLINYPCGYTSLSDALQYARAAGCIVVSSAGNNGIGDADQSGPGCYPEVISVGATDRDDTRASFSATGQALDVVAPGSGTITTPYHYYNDSYTGFSGTSASCPHVAGVCSVMRAMDRDITHEDAKSLLETNAEDQVGPPRGRHCRLG